MSYLSGTPVGELYVGHVKWDNDYKNVMQFASLSARNSFFTSNFRKAQSNQIYYNNSYIDIGEKIKNIESLNYCYFKSDSDITDTPFCAFIVDYEYLAEKTTRLYIEIDVFQQYFYTSMFFQSYIERAHVGDDAIGKWLAPEPFSVKPEYQKDVSLIFETSDWLPTWVLHSTSLYNENTGKYKYGGRSDDNYGEYGTYISSASDLQDIVQQYGRKSLNETLADAGTDTTRFFNKLSNWLTAIIDSNDNAHNDDIKTVTAALQSSTSASDLEDHRNELIGCYAIPTWAKSGTYPTNTPVNKSTTITLPTGRLACNYAPKNNKLFTSLCRAFIIYTLAGFRMLLNPDLFTAATTTITCSCIPMSVGGYTLGVSNYRDYTNVQHQIGYTCERRIGYDQNTGLDKTLNILTNTAGMIAGAGSIAGGLAGSNPIAIAGGVSGIAQNSVNMLDALGGQGHIIGSTGDLLALVQGRAHPRFIEVSPVYEECERIDKYLTQFGYAIGEVFAPTSFFNTRPYFNYIQTSDINLSAPCPTRYEEQLKQVFNSGVTLWHDYAYFGDYSVDNTL